MLILSVVGLQKAQANNKTTIQISVTLSDSYANVLGSEMTNEAKRLAEIELVQTLQDLIRYFNFVPSTTPAQHQLLFRIAPPTASGAQPMHNIQDYYIYLSLNKKNIPLAKELKWLFRDAASSLSGADTPMSITQSLSQDVREKHNNIIGELLSHVSFTASATFKNTGSVKGWFIQHSAKALCLYKRSKLRITSMVPDEGFEDEFSAEVKKHRDDHITTFTKAESDVSSLLTAPEQAKVLAVHVVSYERLCEQSDALSEVSPASVNFTQGGE